MTWEIVPVAMGVLKHCLISEPGHENGRQAGHKKSAPGGGGSTPDTLFVAKAYRLNEIFRENGN
ncbi:hypothetical protein GCM10007921_32200 [Tritonibacter mobilis]|nr:hypothetical protein GCM10007921_32200 [Tritonibacter mobilis]